MYFFTNIFSLKTVKNATIYMKRSNYQTVISDKLRKYRFFYIVPNIGKVLLDG